MPGRVKEARPALRAITNSVSGSTAVTGIVRTALAVVDAVGLTCCTDSTARVVNTI